jgi:hypothetical protein
MYLRTAVFANSMSHFDMIAEALDLGRSGRERRNEQTAAKEYKADEGKVADLLPAW